MEAGQRPVRLARVVLRSAVDLCLEPIRAVLRDDRTGRLGHRREEPTETTQQIVVRGVAGQFAPLDQTGREQCRATGRRPPVVGERGPVVVFDEVLADPRHAAVGACQRIGLTGAGSLVEAHDRTGVSNEVVPAEIGVVVGVVLVQPRAVRVLVAREPLHRLTGRSFDAGRGRLGAMLRRGEDTEGDHADTQQTRPRQRDAAPA